MQSRGTLLLGRSDVASLLSLEECIEAVERVFRWQGEGRGPAPAILGVKAAEGSLHVKAGFLGTERSYFVAKLNTNFPANTHQFGLPRIPGVIVIYDGENGYPLAVIDSIDVTVKSVHCGFGGCGKRSARDGVFRAATVCGSGKQGHAQLRALHAVLPLTKAYAFDRDERVASRFATVLAAELKLGDRVGA